jgi:hypothetical protein
MLLGQLPSDALLQKHSLAEYADLKRALVAGDVALLQKTLQVRPSPPPSSPHPPARTCAQHTFG